MSIESQSDWKGLKAAAHVARITLDALAKQVRPGVTTGKLDEAAAQIFAAHGGRSAPAFTYGFPRTVLISVNDEIVHGIPGARRIATGDIVKIDVTVEARAGVRVNEIGRAVEREVRRRGFSVIKGLSGHGVGRTIHEEPTVPNYYDPFQTDVLTEGLVLTIEPMISAGSTQVVEDDDGWTLRTRDGSLSAHYEHTLVITRGEPIVLTAA
jgi:methionyl aminopeptidase